MNYKRRKSKITKPSKTVMYIAVGLGYFVTILFSAIFPYYSGQYLLFSIPLGVLSFLSVIWLARHSNFYVKYFLLGSISVLCALPAYRSLSYLFYKFSPFVNMLIIFSVVFVNVIPAWNPSVATFISNELYAPKTRVGKLILRAILALAPLAGISGLILAKSSKSGVSMFIIGILTLYLSLSVPFIGLSPYSVKQNLQVVETDFTNKETVQSITEPPKQHSPRNKSQLSRKEEK